MYVYRQFLLRNCFAYWNPSSVTPRWVTGDVLSVFSRECQRSVWDYSCGFRTVLPFEIQLSYAYVVVYSCVQWLLVMFVCVVFFFLFVYRHFPQYFSYIVAVNFIGEGNRSILGKSKACSSPNQYNPMVAIACTCTDIYVYSNVENKSRGRHMWEIIFI